MSAPIAGTQVYFDVDADTQQPEHFYDLPFPLDTRLDAAGHPRLAGFPRPAGLRLINGIANLAEDRLAFPTDGAVYFRFNDALAAQDIDTVIPAAPTSPVLWIDIDPASPDYLRLLPTVATNPPTDAYVPSGLLAIGTVPGFVLRPHTTYAVVIRRSLHDADDQPLGVPAAMAALRAGQLPSGEHGAALANTYAPLWTALDALGIERTDVAAATVLTTGDVVAELAELISRLRQRYALQIESLALDPDDGADHPRFCELAGSVTMPQFQRGLPPFNSLGQFAFADDGLPIEQRSEVVPIRLTIPRQPMPAGGYPLVVYFHGSNGLSSQVVDRGAVTEPGGTPRKGEGPAHVLAAHGFAAFGSSHPLSPERYPAGGDKAYLNFSNLTAYRDTFRQGTIEQSLLIDAIARLEIDPEVLAECSGPTLPNGATAFRIRTEPLFIMGQSMGGQYTNMVGAVDPRVTTAVPTGSGGMFNLLILVAEIVPGGNARDLLKTLLRTDAPLTHLHPALNLLQIAWEAAEPIVYATRVAKWPLPGHPARSVYHSTGFMDPDFPTVIYDAMAVATGSQEAGPAIWPSMQTALALDSRAGLLPYPVQNNRVSETGQPITAVAVQYAGDGILSPHHIVAQLDAVKRQYGCFFATREQTGTAVVVAPGPLDEPCL